MRVTMLGPLPPHKGVSPYFWSLCCAVAAEPDMEVDVLSFRSMYPSWLYPGGNPVHATADTRDVPGAKRTRRTLRWWNPLGWALAGLSVRGDVLHVQWWSFALAPMFLTIMALARFRGKKLVVTVHNVEPHEPGVARRLANRSVLPLAQTIIVHAARSREALIRRGYRPSQVAVLPIGVRNPVAVTPESRAKSRRQFGVDDETPLLLFLGNIRPYKGLSDLLRAFQSLVHKLPSARLVIAGQPWTSPAAIHEEIAALGITDSVLPRLEFISEELMETYLVAADIAVYPYTHFDAQSAAACDALRFGRAIVVTDVGGLPDLVAHPAAIVPPRSPDALASALELVLTDTTLRTTLEKESYERATALSWSAIADETARVYRDTLVCHQPEAGEERPAGQQTSGAP